MAVAFNAVGPDSSGASANAASSLTWSHTNSGNAIVVGATADINPDTGLSFTATYAGISMAAGALIHTNAASSGFLQVFTLANPPTGANNVVVTLSSGTANLRGGSISLTGAGRFVAQYSATGNSATPSATSAGSSPNSLICAFAGVGSNIISATSPSTSRFLDNPAGGAAGAGFLGGATSPGTGSNVTTAWSSTSDFWAVIGVEVLADTDPVGRATPGRTWRRRYQHHQLPPAASAVAPAQPAATTPTFLSQYSGRW